MQIFPGSQRIQTLEIHSDVKNKCRKNSIIYLYIKMFQLSFLHYYHHPIIHFFVMRSIFVPQYSQWAPKSHPSASSPLLHFKAHLVACLLDVLSLLLYTLASVYYNKFPLILYLVPHHNFISYASLKLRILIGPLLLVQSMSR